MTKIEWTEKSWNPIVGCSIVSPGCTNCYAMKMAARIEAMGSAPHYAGLTKKVNGNAVWTGKLALAPQRIIEEPFHRRTPTTWFVNSMGDLFHEGVQEKWIDRVFAVMALAPWHTFQVLTKRSRPMRDYLTDPELAGRIFAAMMAICRERGGACVTPALPLANVWLGVSAERQQEADERIPDLLATPATVRFVSAEPLLGPIDFRQMRLRDPYPQTHDALSGHSSDTPWHFVRTKARDPAGRGNLDWVIVGGESGPNARPMHPDWARSIRDQCVASGVAFFFKQHGQHIGHSCVTFDHQGAHTSQTLGRPSFEAHGERFWTIGKKAAGRLLDGREWNELPALSAKAEAA